MDAGFLCNNCAILSVAINGIPCVTTLISLHLSQFTGFGVVQQSTLHLGGESCLMSESYKPREYQKVKLMRVKQILRARIYVACIEALIDLSIANLYLTLYIMRQVISLHIPAFCRGGRITCQVWHTHGVNDVKQTDVHTPGFALSKPLSQRLILQSWYDKLPGTDLFIIKVMKLTAAIMRAYHFYLL